LTVEMAVRNGKREAVVEAHPIFLDGCRAISDKRRKSQSGVGELRGTCFRYLWGSRASLGGWLATRMPARRVGQWEGAIALKGEWRAH